MTVCQAKQAMRRDQSKNGLMNPIIQGEDLDNWQGFGIGLVICTEKTKKTKIINPRENSLVSSICIIIIM